MIEPIEYIFEDTINKKVSLKGLNDLMFCSTLDRLDLDKSTNFTKTTDGIVKMLKLYEYLYGATEKVNENCRKVLQTMLILGDKENKLVNTINSIINSDYHKAIEMYYNMNRFIVTDTKFSTSTIPIFINWEIYFDYYIKIFELNTILLELGFDVKVELLDK